MAGIGHPEIEWASALKAYKFCIYNPENYVNHLIMVIMVHFPSSLSPPAPPRNLSHNQLREP